MEVEDKVKEVRRCSWGWEESAELCYGVDWDGGWV